MKFYNLILMFVVLLGTSLTCSASIPTVSEVESTIAAGNYAEAREQLGKVLKENPDSYVANRYMFEIVKIENGRDNVSSVEYKLYEDRVNKITQQTQARLAAEAKAKQDKLNEERWQATLTMLYTLFGIIGISGLGFLGHIKYRVYQNEKVKKKELEDWTNRVTADMLDLEKGFEKASLLPLGSHKSSLLEDLSADNSDALNQVLEADVNRSAVDRHISNAREFLRDCGVSI